MRCRLLIKEKSVVSSRAPRIGHFFRLGLVVRLRGLERAKRTRCGVRTLGNLQRSSLTRRFLVVTVTISLMQTLGTDRAGSCNVVMGKSREKKRPGSSFTLIGLDHFVVRPIALVGSFPGLFPKPLCLHVRLAPSKLA
jgi:hypothetical protein